MKMETKTCTKCGQEKPLSEFGKDGGHKDGFSYWCFQCWRKYHAEYRDKNREKIKARNKEYWAKYYEKNKERLKAARNAFRRQQRENKS